MTGPTPIPEPCREGVYSTSATTTSSFIGSDLSTDVQSVPKTDNVTTPIQIAAYRIFIIPPQLPLNDPESSQLFKYLTRIFTCLSLRCMVLSFGPNQIADEPGVV